MPALYSHTTRATGTVLTATIYNGDHQNHIDNGVPLQHDDYSSNAAQMQTTSDPGEAGSESLATTQAGEFERLRFILKEMKNTVQWYTSVLGLLGYSRVIGLVGANNAGTPTTQYDISADAVVARDSTGGTLVKLATGTLTCNFATAGPAANGRDQAGAFGASNWVYIYFIMKADGTIASIASLNAPSTGPAALPSGYTHWAFAGSVRWNGSSNIIQCRMRGNWNYYTVAQAALAGGSASVETTISTSAVVPPSGQSVAYRIDFLATSDGSGNLSADLAFRIIAGVNFHVASVGGILAIGPSSQQRVGGAYQVTAPNIGQQFLYLTTLTLGSSTFLNVDVQGYSMPNGG